MADVVAAGGPSVTNMQTFADLDLEAFPATDLNPNKASDAPAVLLNKAFGDVANKLYLYKITWSGKKASISEPQTIPLSKHYPTPNGGSKKFRAVQPSPGVHVRADEGRRTLSVFARNGSVFGCNSAKRSLDARAGLLWYEVRISDGALLQEGFVDAPDCDYLMPSLAVDAVGNIGLGCTRTSENEFPSVYVMMHAAGDPAGTMRPAVRAVAGTTYFRGQVHGIAEATGCWHSSEPPGRRWTTESRTTIMAGLAGPPIRRATGSSFGSRAHPIPDLFVMNGLLNPISPCGILDLGSPRFERPGFMALYSDDDEASPPHSAARCAPFSATERFIIGSRNARASATTAASQNTSK